MLSKLKSLELRRAAIAMMLLVVLMMSSGCSVFMAASRSTKTDISCLRPGENRLAIINSLGPPDTSVKMESGGSHDYYKIALNAQSKGGKTASVIGHVAMDVLTLGLWEIIGTPLELAVQDKNTTFILNYGPDGNLIDYETIRVD